MENDLSTGHKPLGLFKLVPVPLIAVVLVGALYCVSLTIMNNLPRSSMGEHLLVPFWFCLGVPPVVQIIVTCVAANVFCGNKKSRNYFILWMVILIVVLFLFGFAGLAEKAWRRGL